MSIIILAPKPTKKLEDYNIKSPLCWSIEILKLGLYIERLYKIMMINLK